MNDKTLMVEETGERTLMAASVECPVCHEQNKAGATWCAECGFRLDMTPGEATEAAPIYALIADGQRYPLKSGENVVGRLNADVFLSDPSVSRRHAVITVSEDGVFLRDEGSSNGTRMNNVRMEPGTESPLLPGESVQFGAVPMTLEAPDGAPLATPPAPDRAPARLDFDETPTDPESAPEERPAVAVLTNGVDTWNLCAGRNTIGRRADNDVTISDPAVSGRHAAITIADGVARVADSGSTNGTFIAEQRLVAGVEEVLEPGVALRFGRVVLNYEVVPEEAEAVLAPPMEDEEAAADPSDNADEAPC